MSHPARARRAGRRSGDRPRRRVVPTVAGAVLAPVLALLSLAAAPPPAARAATTASARVTIDTIDPATVTPGATVHIRGQVVNQGSAPLRDLVVELRSQYWPVSTRSSVSAWTATAQAPAPYPARATRRLAATLAPHASTTYQLTLPASALHLPDTAAAFGARGAAVEVFADGPGGRQRVGQQRTFLIWSPTGHPSPLSLTLLAPVTSEIPLADASVPGSGLLASMSRSGRLGRVVRASADPAFSWALDPALVAAARAGSASAPSGPAPDSPTPTGTEAATTTAGTATTPAPATGGSQPAGAGAESVPVGGDGTATAGGTASATSGGSTGPADAESSAGSSDGTGSAGRQAAADWLSAIAAGLPGRSAVALPYSDPDLAALARGRAGGLYKLARTQATAVVRSVLGTTLRTDVAWPAGGLTDQATLDTIAAQGGHDIILADTAQPPAQQLTYTPSGRSELSLSNSSEQLGGLLYDSTLSAELAATGGTSPALATQQLLADLATISAERPNQPRSVLAVTPRDWSPTPAGVEATTRALHAASWLHLEPLTTLAAQKAPGLRRSGPTYPKQAGAAELPTQQVRAVVAAYTRLKQFAPALTQPEDVLPELEASITSLLGNAWRPHLAAQRSARQLLDRRVDALFTGVEVLTGSNILFLARAARLPVTLENQLDQPVRVILTLQPRSAKLLVRNGIMVTLEAHRRQQVYVPVRVLANGDVQVTAELSSPDGAVLKASEPILVRLHSDWENRGIAVAGVLLGILVVAGLVRGVRRGRTRIPPESVPDADEEVVARDSRPRTPSAPFMSIRPPSTPSTPPAPDERPEQRSEQESQQGSAPAPHPDDAGAGRWRGAP